MNLPPGFELDSDDNENVSLPPGFVLDKAGPERTTWDEDLAQGFAGVGNTADRFLTMAGAGLASIAGQNRGGRGEVTDEMFRNMEERIKSRNEWAGGQGKEKGLSGHLISAVGGLPGLPLMPVSGIDRSMDMIDKGVPLERASLAGAVDSSLSLVGAAIPVVGKTIAGRVASGAAANMGTGAVSDVASNIIGGKDLYNPLDPNTRLAEGITGGVAGAMITNRPKVTNEHNLNLDTSADVSTVDPARAQLVADMDGQLQAQNRKIVTDQLDASLPRAAEGMRDVFARDEQAKAIKERAIQQQAQARREDTLHQLEQGDNPLYVGRDGVAAEGAELMDIEAQRSANNAELEQLRSPEQAAATDYKNVANQATIDEPIARSLFDEEQLAQKQREIDDAYTQREEQLAQERAFGKQMDEAERLQNGVEEPLRQRLRVPKSQLGAVDVDGLKKGIDEIGRKLERLRASPMYQNSNFMEKMNNELPLVRQQTELMKQLNDHYDAERSARQANELESFKGLTNSIGDSISDLKAKAERSNFSIVPWKQRGALDLGNATDPQHERIAAMNQSSPEVIKAQTDLKREVMAGIVGQKYGSTFSKPENVIAAIANGAKDISNFQKARGGTVSPGMNAVAINTQHPFLRFVANTIKESQLMAENMARVYITGKDGLQPLLYKLKQVEKNGANAILQKGDKEQRFIGRDEMIRMGASENTIKFVEKIYEIDKVKLDLWNDIRKKVGLPEVKQRPGHFPGVFRGDYKTVVYKTVDGEKRVVGVITADTQWQLDKYKKAVQNHADYKDVTFSEMDRRALGGNGRRSDLFSGVSDLLEILSRDNPEYAKLQEIARSALPEQADALFGAALHSLNKKGVFGNEGNKFWKDNATNANDAINSYIKYWEEGIYSHLNIPAEAKIRALMDNPALDNHPNAKKLAKEYVGNATGRGIGSLGEGLNKVIDGALAKPFRLGPSYPRELINQLNKRAGQWTMGMMNYVFAGVQMAQIAQTAVPRMMSVAHDLGINQVVAPTAAMSKTIAQIPNIIMEHFGKENGLSPVMKQAVEEARKRGINQFSEFHDVNQLTQNKVSRAFDRTGDMLREYSERYSRSMVFYSFVNMLDGKVPKDQLFDVAYNATQKAMFDYSFAERPMMYQKLGTVGQLAGSLQTFKHNFLSEQASLWKEAKRGNPLPALTSTAMLGAFAGITGMPFYDEIDSIVKWITNKFVGEQKNIEQLVLERLPEWQDKRITNILARGYVSDATGLSLQSRFSSANILPDSPAQAVSPYSGFYNELGGAAIDAIKDPQNPQSWKDLAVASTPSIARPQAQVSLQMNENKKGEKMIMNRKGQNGNPLTEKDLAARRWGLRTQNETLQNERQWVETTRAMGKEEAREAIIQRLTKNIRQGNGGKEILQKYWDMYAEREGQPAAFVAAVKQARIDRQLPKERRLEGIPKNNSVPSINRHENYDEYYSKPTR